MNDLALSLISNGVSRVGYESRETYGSLPEEFYYMSYGSNLCMDRFMCYVEGGKPERSTRTYLGCRDVTPPKESFGVVFEGSVYFANYSNQWGGGGFLFADFDYPKLSLGRVHLVTREQFSDIVSQECGFEAGGVDVDFDKILTVGHVVGKGLLYGHTVYVGTLNHLPVISFTTGYSQRDVVDGFAPFSLNQPSDAYDKVVRKGLIETFGLDKEQLDSYMDDTLGYL